MWGGGILLVLGFFKQQLLIAFEDLGGPEKDQLEANAVVLLLLLFGVV